MAIKIATGPTTRLVPPTARTIGDSGMAVYPLALGGNVFGWHVDDRSARLVLDEFVDAGGMLVDTADSYAGGRSETIIGSWMAARGNRDRLVVATKVGKSADHPGMRPSAVARAVEASLGRLRTDVIDLLFLHTDDPTVPFEETLLVVDRLIREGKVRAFGASDHSGARLTEARINAGLLGVASMSAVQHQYSLVRRTTYEQELAGVAEAQGLGVLPRFALAGGFLTGKYRTREDVRRSRRSRDVAPYFTRQGLKLLGVLDAVAEAQGVPMATVALAWLLGKPQVVAPVVSATAPGQLHELMAAPMIALTRDQVRMLDQASA